MKTLVLLLCFIASVCSQNCPDWQEAPYEEDPDAYTRGEGTPRGFRLTTIPNPETAQESDYPCITVRAESTIQYMEVLIQTFSETGASNICVDVDGISEPTCNAGTTSFCDKVPNMDPVVTFNCNSGCDQSDVQIYYRVNLSRSDIDDEYYCQDRVQDFPSGLITFVPPTDITRQPQITESALGLHSFSLFVLLGLSLLVLAVGQLVVRL